MENFGVDAESMRDAQAEAYLNSFSVGYRFCPTDAELLHYLHNKVFKLPLPPNKIREVNIYKFCPEELSEMYKDPREERMYFFTPRDRKYPRGRRPNRVAGNGYWKASGPDKAVESNGNVLGYNKSLAYYRGEHKESVKTNWIMHEFTLNIKSSPTENRGAPDDMKLDDCVLCQMYEKSRKVDIKGSTMVDEMNDQSESSFIQTMHNRNVPELPPVPHPDAMGGSSSQQLVSRGQNLISLPPTMALPDAMHGSSSQQLVSRERCRFSLPPTMAHPDAMRGSSFQQFVPHFSLPPTMAHPAAAAAYSGISSSQNEQTAIPMPESNPNMLLQHRGQNYYSYDPASNLQVQQYQNYNTATSNQIQPYQHCNCEEWRLCEGIFCLEQESHIGGK